MKHDRFGDQLDVRKGMLFRDDIDPTNTWITSDNHFGHRNIVDFANRPPDHESIMLEKWATAVPDTGTLLHLGDLCYRGNAEFRALIAPHLTGARKLLIKGNHDRQRPSFYRKCGFKFARPFKLKWGSWVVSLSHYPWSIKDEGRAQHAHELRIHGHIHTSGYTRSAYVPFLKNHINVSVEQTGYQPINLALLLAAVIDGRYPVSAEGLEIEDIEERSSHHV